MAKRTGPIRTGPRNFADPSLRGKNMTQALQELKRQAQEAQGLSQEALDYLAHLEERKKAGLGRVSAGYSVRGGKTFVAQQDVAARRDAIRGEKLENKEKEAAAVEKARLRASARAIDKKWGTYVSQALHQVNVQSWGALQQILSQVQQRINESLAASERIIYTKQVAQIRRYHAYQDGVLRLQKMTFNLWVRESGVVPKFLDDPVRMRRFADELHDKVQKAIHIALDDVITDCISKVAGNPLAWPRDYTRLLATVAERAKANGKFDIQGASISGWWMKVDFAEIFGGPELLDPAVHYRALLKDSTPDSVKRVEHIIGDVPDTDLKHPDAATRYKYWKAMASGQKFYYGGYESHAVAKTGMARGRVGIRKRMKSNRITMMALADTVADTHRDPSKAKETYDAAYAYKDLAKTNADLGRKLEVRPKGFPIPFGEWDRTVQARVAYWNTLNKAPIWWYLEFGQLRWAPTLPAQGLTLKFFNKARAIVDAEVEALLQAELASYDIAGADSYGPRSSGKPIRFGKKAGSVQRKGTFLPRDAIPPMNRVLTSHNRNAQEAAAAAGTFSKPVPLIGTWVDPGQVPGQARMWEGSAYTQLSPHTTYKSTPISSPPPPSKFRSPIAKGQLRLWAGGSFPPPATVPSKSTNKRRKLKRKL